MAEGEYVFGGDTGDAEEDDENFDWDEWERQQRRQGKTPHQDKEFVIDDEKDDEPSLQGRVNLKENVNIYKVDATPERLKAAARLEGAKSRGFTSYETVKGEQKRQTMAEKVKLKKQ